MKAKHSISKITSVVLMIMTLGWLTISTPYVFAAQENVKNAAAQNKNIPPDEEESGNPFANTTEEKTETNSNTLSEYLHDHETYILSTDNPLKHNKCHEASVYVAFHGELLTPPPEFLG